MAKRREYLEYAKTPQRSHSWADLPHVELWHWIFYCETMRRVSRTEGFERALCSDTVLGGVDENQKLAVAKQGFVLIIG